MKTVGVSVDGKVQPVREMPAPAGALVEQSANLNAEAQLLAKRVEKLMEDISAISREMQGAKHSFETSNRDSADVSEQIKRTTDQITTAQLALKSAASLVEEMVQSHGKLVTMVEQALEVFVKNPLEVLVQRTGRTVEMEIEKLPSGKFKVVRKV